MKKILKFSSVMIIIIIFLISFNIWNEYASSWHDLSIDYEFTVTQSNDSYYRVSYFEIYIPMPQMPHKIERKEGKFEIDKIDTEYGKAYRVMGSGSIRLIIKGYQERHTLVEDKIPSTYHGFTTQNDSYEDGQLDYNDRYHYWINLNRSQIQLISFNINIQTDSVYGDSAHELTFNGEITEGWILIEPHRESEYGDGIRWLDLYEVLFLPLLIMAIIILACGIIIIKVRDSEQAGINKNQKE